MTAPVKLFWWRWRYPHRLNFGDEFSAPLIELLSGRRVEWAPPDTCDVLAAGSILQMLMRRGGTNSPMIWGSGFIRDHSAEGPFQLDVRAVRGTSTRGMIQPANGRPPVLGDPGLLAHHLLDRPVRKKYELGVVPHYKDAEDPVIQRFRAMGTPVRVIDVAWTPQEVAHEISSCDAILSSSLHGLIFADALGVPNQHVKLGAKMHGGLFKFDDYYSAFEGQDRYAPYVPPPPGLLDIHSVAADVHDNYVVPTGLARLQDDLVKALPV